MAGQDIIQTFNEKDIETPAHEQQTAVTPSIAHDEEKHVGSGSESDYSNDGKANNHHQSDPSIEQVEVERGAKGVAQAEAFTRLLRKDSAGRLLLVLLAISIFLSMFAYALDQGLTGDVFSVIAASAFSKHSEVASISVASRIITAVSKPFIGKLSDLTSRPTMYTVVLIFYVVGFAVAASAKSFAAYVVGICFTAFAKSGLDLLADIIVADLTPLQWRQFFTAMLSSPFIITTYIGGPIADGLVPDHWRWGAGMFCILMPVLLGPAITLLFYMQHKAKKMGVVSLAGSGLERKGKTDIVKGKSLYEILKNAAVEIDAVGLILVGFGFALLLLPFALANNARGRWANPSMIAMLVVGFVLLIAFAIWELYAAPIPLAPRRILLNRAFQIAILVDILTMFASFIEALYFTSYIYVIKDWTNLQWVYFTGTVTVGLCIWGLINGLLQRYTHRFKAQMVFGGVCKVIGYAVLLDAGPLGTTQNSKLIAAVLLLSFGGLTVGGARIASQAAVAHRDLTTAIFTVSFWSSFGSSCGAAVAATVWQQKMPIYLAQELPNETAATRKALFGSIRKAHALAFDSEVRQGVIRAFQRTNGILFTMAACLAVVPLILTFFVPNYWLGTQHNLVDNKDLDGKPVRIIRRRANEDEDEETFDATNATMWEKFKYYAKKAWDA